MKIVWEVFIKLKIFSMDALNKNGALLHGKIRSGYGAKFLRQNKQWLE